MAYTVLARKWRPARFEDFVGQEAVAMTLRRAVETDRVAHAYLFAGERGTGKTSMVRVLAKALNCEKGPTGEPCNQCSLCRDIHEGRDMDVLEIDGASYRKVEEISEILKNVGFRPARARFKIYIIDEVHMLSEHAFNALLKTLEEPPPHVKFIFATTEPDELLDTVKSRCQRFDFRKISTEAIAKRLRQICDAEQIKADDRALLAIAKNARGGMRDALTILDQVVSFSSDALTPEAVHAVLGLPTEERVAQLVETVAARDPAGCLKSLGQMLDEGKDPLDVLAQVVDYARDLIVLKTLGAGVPAVGVQIENLDHARSAADRFSLEQLMYMIQILSEARRRGRERALARVTAEVALIKATQFGMVADLGELLRKIDTLDASRRGGSSVAQSGAEYRVEPAAPPAPKPTIPPDEEEPPPPPEESAPPPAPKVQAGTPLTTEIVQGVWPDIVLRVKLTKARIGMWLARTVLESVEADTLTIAFPSNMVAFERQQLENAENRQVIERCASEVLGRSVVVRFSARRAPATPTPELELPPPPPRRDDVCSDPIVKKALELFDGRIIKVEER